MVGESPDGFEVMILSSTCPATIEGWWPVDDFVCTIKDRSHTIDSHLCTDREAVL